MYILYRRHIQLYIYIYIYYCIFNKEYKCHLLDIYIHISLCYIMFINYS